MPFYLSNRDGDGKTDEEGHYKFPVNAFAGNVLNTSDLVVTQQSPTALGVAVAPGQYRIPDGSGDFSYTGWSDSAVNVSISTADPANPRISSIVVYVDKSEATSPSPPNNPGVVKIVSVNGTAAAVPTPPNGATIQSAIGSGNPYIVIANATVEAAGTTVVNAQISDQRTMVTLISNLVNTAAIQDLAVTTGKLADLAVTTGKTTDLAMTTRKLKPSYTVVNGNNGGSRQTFPTLNTTYTITGSAINYTSGPTAELLVIDGSAMCNFTGSASNVFLTVGGTQIGKSSYSDQTVWLRRHVHATYEIPANTSITIDLRARTGGTGGGSVANSSSDQSANPSFGMQVHLIAWGRS